MPTHAAPPGSWSPASGHDPGPTPDAADATDVAVRRLKAVADPVRLRLLELITTSPDGEACLCDLNAAFDITQPTMSHHLKLLHQAGLLDREKRGVWAYYRVRSSTITELTTLLANLQ